MAAELCPQPDEQPAPYNSHLPGSFIPVNPRRLIEQETMWLSIADRHHQIRDCNTIPSVPCPQTGDTPVNEFQTEGYMTCAFPTLVPTGAGDFTAPHQRIVTIGYYFKYLMLYKDGRFAKHARFRLAESMFATTHMMHVSP